MFFANISKKQAFFSSNVEPEVPVKPGFYIYKQFALFAAIIASRISLAAAEKAYVSK